MSPRFADNGDLFGPSRTRPAAAGEGQRGARQPRQKPAERASFSRNSAQADAFKTTARGLKAASADRFTDFREQWLDFLYESGRSHGNPEYKARQWARSHGVDTSKTPNVHVTLGGYVFEATGATLLDQLNALSALVGRGPTAETRRAEAGTVTIRDPHADLPDNVRAMVRAQEHFAARTRKLNEFISRNLKVPQGWLTINERDIAAAAAVGVNASDHPDVTSLGKAVQAAVGLEANAEQYYGMRLEHTIGAQQESADARVAAHEGWRENRWTENGSNRGQAPPHLQ